MTWRFKGKRFSMEQQHNNGPLKGPRMLSCCTPSSPSKQTFRNNVCMLASLQFYSMCVTAISRVKFGKTAVTVRVRLVLNATQNNFYHYELQSFPLPNAG